MVQKRGFGKARRLVVVVAAALAGALWTAVPSAAQTARTFTLDGPNGPIMYRDDGLGRVFPIGPAARDPFAIVDPRSRVPPPVVAPPPMTRIAPAPEKREATGDWRTLCVRTCDGYVFQISQSTGRDSFDRDAKTCAALCPAAETRLFVHRNGEDAETTLAAADNPKVLYTKLPTAFLYQTRVVARCTCSTGAVQTWAEDAGEPGDAQPIDLVRRFPLPRKKPRPGTDPDTLQNEMAGLKLPDLAAAPHLAARPRGVRVVGPAFLVE